MPAKRTKSKSRRLDDYKRQQLLEGPERCLLAGVGYIAPYSAATFSRVEPAEQVEVLAQMEADWHLSGDELMAWWNAGKDAERFSDKPWIFPANGSPDRKPWALNQFGDPNGQETR